MKAATCREYGPCFARWDEEGAFPPNRARRRERPNRKGKACTGLGLRSPVGSAYTAGQTLLNHAFLGKDLPDCGRPFLPAAAIRSCGAEPLAVFCRRQPSNPDTIPCRPPGALAPNRAQARRDAHGEAGNPRSIKQARPAVPVKPTVAHLAVGCKGDAQLGFDMRCSQSIQLHQPRTVGSDLRDACCLPRARAGRRPAGNADGGVSPYCGGGQANRQRCQGPGSGPGQPASDGP